MASYTQSDLANITAAIASGVQSASIQGELVTYRSLSEMLKIQSMISRNIAGASAHILPVRYPETSRGV
jgi:hypothetical protein